MHIFYTGELYTCKIPATALNPNLHHRDIRRPSEPIYTHTQTHSDDITHLSFLPSTSRLSLPSTSPITSGTPIPSLLLLSSSTDGLVALSDVKESDEDEACWATEGLDGSVATAGWYSVGGNGGVMNVNVWARSDMNSVGTWSLGRGEEALEVGWGVVIVRIE